MTYKLSNVYRKFCPLLLSTSRNCYLPDLFPIPSLVIPWSIQPNIHLKSFCCFGCKKYIEGRFITFICSFKGFYPLFILIKSAETKIFIPDNMTIFYLCNRHMVIPDIPGVLHRAYVGKIARVARRVVLIRVQTIYVKTF